jgi:hypothetical protein
VSDRKSQLDPKNKYEEMVFMSELLLFTEAGMFNMVTLWSAK